MHVFDWVILLAFLVFLMIVARKTNKFNLSVADFLVANRCARRYLLGVSEGIANVGAISIIAFFESYYKAGLSIEWWTWINNLVIVAIALSGWVVYRFRQTRAMTMAQFFEERYSKRFRIFSGIIIFISGTINFGIFPAVGARFFLYFCGLPSCHVDIFNWLTIDLTYALIMAILLSIALFFTFQGGQITVIITDFIQGTFLCVAVCAIAVFVFIKLPWNQIADVISQGPPGQSLAHPFDSSQTKDFNMWFFLILAFQTFYGMRAWQGNQGYYGAAENPHEARMGAVIGSWRMITQRLLVLFLPISSLVIMKHHDWSQFSDMITGILDNIGKNSGEIIRTQVTTTVILSKFLPVGLTGGLAGAVLAAFISTHDTYLHSWGSVFIQDVVMPFRKKSLGSKEHIRLLQKSIFGVAVFTFLFSLFFPQNTYVYMFLALSGAIWMGGAGAVIIGGLYWKRGTTTGAYAAIITGIVISILGFILPRVWTYYGKDFPINAMVILFIAMISSSIVYVIVSLLFKPGTCTYNIDKLLHRDKYEIKDDKVEAIESARGLSALLGNIQDYKLLDKITYLFIIGWSIAWAVLFMVVTAYNLIFDVEQATWIKFWKYYLWMSLLLGVLTTIWLTIGGISDVRSMFAKLKKIVRDYQDDGTVTKSVGKNQMKE